jgi:hypothetical protein
MHFKRDLFRKNTHYYEIEAEHLFYVFLFKKMIVYYMV